MKEFNQKVITMGFVLEFRKLLRNAMSQVFQSRFPFLAASIAVGDEYATKSRFPRENYPNLGALASDIGLPNRPDEGLANAMKPLCVNQTTDFAAWSLLPYLFSAVLWYMAQDDGALYNIFVDAIVYDSLSAHLLSSMPHEAANGGIPGGPVASSHVEFLNVASTILLRMRQKEYQAKQLHSAILVLKRFAEQSKHLPSSTTEEYLPCSLVTAMMSELYKRRAPPTMAQSGGMGSGKEGGAKGFGSGGGLASGDRGSVIGNG
ncbi:hypothetical protein HK102_009273, partial [Quaeritorhiza haematococci]